MSAWAGTRTVAVVGNGAAGTLLVIGILREATRRGTPLRVDWIGDGLPGRGVAYATMAPWHRLNVPAPAMTLSEATQTFPDWLPGHVDDEDTFAPREAFGSYLLATLAEARSAAPRSVELRCHHDRAVGIDRDEAVRVELRTGDYVPADRVVLALGPFPGPPLSTGLDRDARSRVIDDPWDGSLAALNAPEHVLLVGTGLTMVDVALSIAHHHPRTRMLAISRTGLVPRRNHHSSGDAAEPATRPGAPLEQALDQVRAHIAARPEQWREIVDGLRPVTQDLWRGWTRHDQRRFLAEHARAWEVHRHRMAPSVADELDQLRLERRLEFATAELAGLSARDGRLRVRLENAGARWEIDTDRAVSCAGAQDDVTKVDDPLVDSLLRSDLARGHPLGLGFDTTDHGAMRTDTGVSERVFAIGVLRRGELYETTAIPEIREQAADLAHLLVADAS